jgi:hypothetical protein
LVLDGGEFYSWRCGWKGLETNVLEFPTMGPNVIDEVINIGVIASLRRRRRAKVPCAII